MAGSWPTSAGCGERIGVSDLHAAQQDLCRRFGADFAPTAPEAAVSAALASLVSGLPIHGARHHPRGDGSGWLLWAGDLSSDPEFFQAMPAGELIEHAPAVLPYLGLPPGWRFLLAPGYEDAWFDATLLDG